MIATIYNWHFKIKKCGYKLNSYMDKVVMGAIGMQGFDKTEQVWQLKWPPITCLMLNLQLTVYWEMIAGYRDCDFAIFAVLT